MKGVETKPRGGVDIRGRLGGSPSRREFKRRESLSRVKTWFRKYSPKMGDGKERQGRFLLDCVSTRGLEIEGVLGRIRLKDRAGN